MINYLDFLAGNFFDFELPREKLYLFKYFRSSMQKSFLRYYYCFDGEFAHFTDHTGIACQRRWLLLLRTKLNKILAAHAKAKEEMNLSMVKRIERGKLFWKTRKAIIDIDLGE
jgi:hypothetical protein